jgi:hypothetical protein
VLLFGEADELSRGTAGVAAVWGTLREHCPGSNFYKKMNHLFYRRLPLGHILLRGGNYLGRRSALEAAGSTFGPPLNMSLPAN